ncbi:MAG TPA: SagB/ThcOx family dehydrogenase [Aestuariivirga sp.]
MRVKTPQSLVTFPKNDQVIVYNYLTKDAVTCAPADVYWLMLAGQWTSIDDIIENHPHVEPLSLRRQLLDLVETGMLLEEGSGQALRESSYTKSWEMGIAAGLYHFAALDNEFGSAEESVAKQKEKNLTSPSPELFWKNSGNAYRLPKCEMKQTGSLRDLMARRRSVRKVLPTGLSLEELSDCLYSGLGITGFVQTETALLPLKMTPSGGARNPFEAFIWVKDVQGLEPGIYHYSALEHSVQFVDHLPAAPAQNFVQKQNWADDMPAIIFLVAVLERVTWKYNDPNAYRVVMIEAGHVAQNMMLACTNNNLTACPTAALNHTMISDVLGLSNITQTPIYAILVGHPDESDDIILPVSTGAMEANPQ